MQDAEFREIRDHGYDDRPDRGYGHGRRDRRRDVDPCRNALLVAALVTVALTGACSAPDVPAGVRGTSDASSTAVMPGVSDGQASSRPVEVPSPSGSSPTSSSSSGSLPPVPEASASPGTGPPSGRGPARASASAVDVLRHRQVTSWAYQLQGYAHDRLDALAGASQRLVVIDLARDARSDWFTPAELAGLHARGKTALAYFEIGSVENYRPEYAQLRRDGAPLILNQWDEWPEEYFVRYWDARWWNQVIRPRIDQALRAGFDGVYLDTPLAYESVDLRLVPGWTRERLARAMVDLIVRIGRYAKARTPGFWIFPQNSPELRRYPGYRDAIDGIGMEELFFRATDRRCTEDYCAENLREARALHAAGKVVLAVDYARRPENVAAACAAYRREGFLGYVTSVDLDSISAGCP
jgi:cysteinyl-tRNA synthetase, unknown class